MFVKPLYDILFAIISNGGYVLPGINETVYPRFKSTIDDNDLKNVYTPTSGEILYANQVTRSSKNRLLFLIMLKTCQRLGYFVNITDVPELIITHIATSTGIANISIEYEKSETRLKHIYSRPMSNIAAINRKSKSLYCQSIYFLNKITLINNEFIYFVI